MQHEVMIMTRWIVHLTGKCVLDVHMSMGGEEQHGVNGSGEEALPLIHFCYYTVQSVSVANLLLSTILCHNRRP